MTSESSAGAKGPKTQDKQDRLAQKLRENLKKRKTQARARKETQSDKDNLDDARDA